MKYATLKYPLPHICVNPQHTPPTPPPHTPLRTLPPPHIAQKRLFRVQT